jgi:hypothetical protein
VNGTDGGAGLVVLEVASPPFAALECTLQRVASVSEIRTRVLRHPGFQGRGAVLVYGIDGLVLFQGGGQALHHAALLVGLGGGKVLLFERIVGQVE